MKKVSIALSFLLLTFNSVLADDHGSKFGGKEKAKELLTRAVNLVKSNETVAFAMITAGTGGLSYKDLYPFCTSMTGIMVAHPLSSGTDMMKFITSDGLKVADIMLKNAKEGKISKLSYMLYRPVDGLDGEEFKKTTYYTKVGEYVCASGYYSK